MRLLAGLWMAGLLAAQTPDPGLVRGTLLECDAGELSVRTATHQVFRFRFDDRTYFEQDREHAKASTLRTGEIVEVVADRMPGTVLRYARTVHVIEPPKPKRPESLGRLRAWTNPVDTLVPRGNITFSGVVFRVTATQLAMHTRDGGDKIVALRQDTRYLNRGDAAERQDLRPNQRVYVRAGRDLYGELEAFQVVWGEILQPQE